jgi:hypothetical protein
VVEGVKGTTRRDDGRLDYYWQVTGGEHGQVTAVLLDLSLEGGLLEESKKLRGRTPTGGLYTAVRRVTMK